LDLLYFSKNEEEEKRHFWHLFPEIPKQIGKILNFTLKVLDIVCLVNTKH